jgi:hypothetical protein
LPQGPILPATILTEYRLMAGRQGRRALGAADDVF